LEEAKDLFPIVEEKKLLPSVVFLEEEEDKARKKFGKARAEPVLSFEWCRMIPPRRHTGRAEETPV
jgi:hypothetical protein